jgi:ferredoxin
MEAKILRHDRLLKWVDAWIGDYEVIAPTDERSFAPIDAASEMELRQEKPTRSPKEFFFPEREVLVSYELSSSSVTLAEASAKDAPRVLFGTRPCDAAALPVLDPLFNWDSIDASFAQRRENTIVVSTACEEPCETCFCVSLGGSPAGVEGSDLLLTPLDDVYHVRVVTERGKELVERYSDLFDESTDERERQSTQVEQAAIGKIGKEVDIEGIEKSLDFDNPLWETITRQCLDCGICTYLCPTCHCFDIQDEGGPDRGQRVRLWDACMFYNYTKAHAGQPRPTHHRRYRQRIMHKFRYYPENFARTLCVGCGRCIKYCPVNIDLRDVLQAVKE